MLAFLCHPCLRLCLLWSGDILAQKNLSKDRFKDTTNILELFVCNYWFASLKILTLPLGRRPFHLRDLPWFVKYTWVLIQDSWKPVKSKKGPKNSENLIKSKKSKLFRKSLKIGPCRPKKLGPFFSLFFMKKAHSSGQKWFLRPYFHPIKGMFVLRSGLRFSFRALEVAETKVRKRL